MSLKNKTTTVETNLPSLWLYLGYRVALALFLAGLFFSQGDNPAFGHVYPGIFIFTNIVFLVLGIAAILLLSLRLIPILVLYQTSIFVDIIVITLFSYATGGVITGFGILLGISISLSGIGLRGHHALLFASLATLTLLTLPVINHSGAFQFAKAGLLGASFFALALLAHQLGRRTRKSELAALAHAEESRRMADINETIIRQMSTGIIVTTASGNIQHANSAAMALLGLGKDCQGFKLSSFFPANRDNSAVQNQTIHINGHTLDIRPIQATEEKSDSDVYFIEDTGAVSEKAQQLKLASLGRLTASIAHEIRNPLSAINHAAQLLSESDSKDEDRQITEIIERNAGRLNAIIDNILNLSRKGTRQPEVLDINDLLARHIQQFIQHRNLKEDQISLNLPESPMKICSDRSQLEQVFEILLDNAVTHFNRPIEGLNITIILNHTDTASSIDIMDNGPGLNRQTRESLFEPFFTTRADGTGLGLYIAGELCQSNHIQLTDVQKDGKGACFRLAFSQEQEIECQA